MFLSNEYFISHFCGFAKGAIRIFMCLLTSMQKGGQ